MWNVLLRVGAAMHVVDLMLSCLLLSGGLMEEANPLADIIYQTGGLAGLVAFKMLILIPVVAILDQAIESRSPLAGVGVAVTLLGGAYAVVMLIAMAGYPGLPAV